ncbi:MAG: hypothetical protein DHS20C05_24750 [Hyphococcus sp.]|nr:MAG: hypothetical protein DHS20C05_24750 [Marinicaulis sp.]
MKVLLLANEAPEEFARRNHPETFKPYMGEWYVFSETMSKAGVTEDSAALEQPSTATVVSVRNGERTVEDGPFPGTKEQLGGFFLLETPDMESAAEWAKQCPAAKTGFVDVRPVPYLEEGEGS